MNRSAEANQRRSIAGRKRAGVTSGRGRFLRMDDVVASTGLSESTIRRNVKNGTMPASVALTTRCVGWWEQDIEAWTNQQRNGASLN